MEAKAVLSRQHSIRGSYEQWLLKTTRSSSSRTAAEVVGLLIAAGVGVDGTSDDRYRTALHLVASTSGRVDIASTVIAAAPGLVHDRDTDLETALHCAARAGKTELLALLKSHGSDPSVRDAYGRTAMHHALSNSNNTLPVVSLLSSWGLSLQNVDLSGRTPLHSAALGCNPRSFPPLIVALREAGHDIDLTTPDAQGDTPLHLIAAVRGADVLGPVLKALCEEAGVLKGLEVRNAAGHTPCHVLLLGGKVASLAEVLGVSEQLRQRFVEMKDEEGKGCLHLAAGAPSASGLISLLIEYGADVNARDNLLRTPLHDAAESRHHAASGALKLLLEHNADPLLSDTNGNLPLHSAASSPCCAVPRVLHLLTLSPSKKNNANQSILFALVANTQVDSAGFAEVFEAISPPEIEVDSYGNTLLHTAVEHNVKVKMVEAVLAVGVPPDALTAKNETALMIAARRNRTSLLEVLCDASGGVTDEVVCAPLHSAAAAGRKDVVDFFCKAIPNAGNLIDSKGRNALHCAVKHGKIPIVFALLETVNPMVKDKELRTPLHEAALGDVLHAGRVLLAGDNVEELVNAEDASGRTALHYAGGNGSLQFLALLLQNGADVAICSATYGTAAETATAAGHHAAAHLLTKRRWCGVLCRSSDEEPPRKRVRFEVSYRAEMHEAVQSAEGVSEEGENGTMSP